jgi:hypothetical protein
MGTKGSHPVTFKRGSSTVSIVPDTADTVIWAPDDGCSYHRKHVEQFTNINKLYIVVFILLDNYWHIFHDARTLEHLLSFLDWNTRNMYRLYACGWNVIQCYILELLHAHCQKKKHKVLIYGTKTVQKANGSVLNISRWSHNSRIYWRT